MTNSPKNTSNEAQEDQIDQELKALEARVREALSEPAEMTTYEKFDRTMTAIANELR